MGIQINPGFGGNIDLEEEEGFLKTLKIADVTPTGYRIAQTVIGGNMTILPIAERMGLAGRKVAGSQGRGM